MSRTRDPGGRVSPLVDALLGLLLLLAAAAVAALVVSGRTEWLGPSERGIAPKGAQTGAAMLVGVALLVAAGGAGASRLTGRRGCSRFGSLVVVSLVAVAVVVAVAGPTGPRWAGEPVAGDPGPSAGPGDLFAALWWPLILPTSWPAIALAVAGAARVTGRARPDDAAAGT